MISISEENLFNNGKSPRRAGRTNWAKMRDLAPASLSHRVAARGLTLGDSWDFLGDSLEFLGDSLDFSVWELVPFALAVFFSDLELSLDMWGFDLDSCSPFVFSFFVFAAGPLCWEMVSVFAASILRVVGSFTCGLDWLVPSPRSAAGARAGRTGSTSELIEAELVGEGEVEVFGMARAMVGGCPRQNSAFASVLSSIT